MYSEDRLTTLEREQAETRDTVQGMRGTLETILAKLNDIQVNPREERESRSPSPQFQTPEPVTTEEIPTLKDDRKS
jgi:hypothetical protein